MEFTRPCEVYRSLIVRVWCVVCVVGGWAGVSACGDGLVESTNPPQNTSREGTTDWFGGQTGPPTGIRDTTPIGRDEGEPCAVTPDCAANLVCREGLCEARIPVEEGGPCAVRLDCAADLVCRGGRCTDATSPDEADDPCEADVDCAMGLVCQGGQCAEVAWDEAKAAGEPCLLDTQCDLDLVCHEGRCEAGCRRAYDCRSSSFACVGWECQLVSALSDGACGDNTHCLSGEVCALGSGQCVADTGACLPDRYEPNDVAATATRSGFVQEDALTLCDGDEDHFVYSLLRGDVLRVDVRFDRGASSLEAVMLDLNGRVIEVADATSDGAVLMRFAQTSQDVVVRVRHVGGEASAAAYGLTVGVERMTCSDDVELNNIPSRATPYTAEGYMHGLTLCPSDTDWFSIEAQEGQGLYTTVFDDTYWNAAVDARILSPSGEVLCDVWGIMTERDCHGVVAPETGVYRVGLIAEYEHTTYALRLQAMDLAACVDPNEPNDTPETATALPIEGAMLCSGDEDWYAFDVEVPRTHMRAWIDAGTNDNYASVEVFDPSGERLPFYIESTQGLPPISGTMVLEVPGRYTARVSGWLHVDNLSATLPYAMGVELVPLVTCDLDANEPNDDASSASVFPLGSSVEGVLCDERDRDVFELVIDAPNTTVEFDFAASPRTAGEPHFTIEDANATACWTSGVCTYDDCAYLFEEPGTYRIVAFLVDGHTMAYTLGARVRSAHTERRQTTRRRRAPLARGAACDHTRRPRV